MHRKSDVVWLVLGAFAALMIVANWVVGPPSKPETDVGIVDEAAQKPLPPRHVVVPDGMDAIPQIATKPAGPKPRTKPGTARSSSLPDESRAVSIAGGGQNWTTAELDHDFKAFLAHQGYAGDEVEQLLSSPASEQKTAKIMPVESRTGEEVAVLERLQESYPVVDARLQANGEVWLQLEPGAANSVAMEDMMAAAAKHGRTGQPVKVVVWSGNRTKAVKTFFGDPVF